MFTLPLDLGIPLLGCLALYFRLPFAGWCRIGSRKLQASAPTPAREGERLKTNFRSYKLLCPRSRLLVVMHGGVARPACHQLEYGCISANAPELHLLHLISPRADRMASQRLPLFSDPMTGQPTYASSGPNVKDLLE